jgi:preprotein translocase subunit SecD
VSRRGIKLAIVVLLAWGGLAATIITGTTPRLGLDLVGGTSVILEAPEGTDEELVITAVEVMRNRIEDFGSVQEPEIAISGGTSVLIQLPGVTDQVRALDAVGQTGQLSFRPVWACTTTIAITCPPSQLSPIQLQALQALAAGEEFVFPEGVDETTGLSFEDDIEAQQSWLGQYEADESGQRHLTSIYEVGPAALTGSDIESALVLVDQIGRWVVQLNLTDEAAGRFAALTGVLSQLPEGSPNKRIAIVLDGEVRSAPGVSADVGPEGITGGTAIITVGGTDNAQQDASDLATVLRYGALPVAFERSSVQKVSATLGEDSLQAGLVAGAGGLVLVVLFLLLYYRAMGFITLIGLTVFASYLLTIFGILGAWQGVTLTLAGVAGVVVSIGITADSYIVFFERTKEEVQKGRTVVDATEEAFRRAFRTILTADFVSFIGALLLWVLAVGPVKGFAQALGIATVLDVFIAYFFTRNAVAVLARSRFGEHGRLSVRAASEGSKAAAIV